MPPCGCQWSHKFAGDARKLMWWPLAATWGYGCGRMRPAARLSSPILYRRALDLECSAFSEHRIALIDILAVANIRVYSHLAIVLQ